MGASLSFQAGSGYGRLRARSSETCQDAISMHETWKGHMPFSCEVLVPSASSLNHVQRVFRHHSFP